MGNTSYKNNLLWLQIDFWVQAILVSINAILAIIGLVGLFLDSQIGGWGLISLLLLQMWTGTIQFGFSAFPRFINTAFVTLETHRKLHFFASILILSILIIASNMNSPLKFIGNSYIEWIISWSYLLFFPQLLMYYYFWITWRDWNDYTNNK